MDLTKYCTTDRHGVCYHGRTAPTDAACECGNGCAMHCNCDLNRARVVREQAERDALAAEAHAREVAEAEREYAALAPRD